MSDCCFILFQSPGISLDQAAELFAPPHWRVNRVDGMLVLQLGDSPVFRIARSSEPHVVIESAEIGDGSPHSDAVSKCDSRFEVLTDDLDSALDEINTLIDVQATLQDATEGFMFTCWNGVLSPPHP